MDWAKQWVNYHHLLYFYVTAREGNVTRAARQLRLTQPTISGQLKLLERSLGQPLFDRAGGRLTLTEAGKVAYRYAEEIFSTGREMVAVIKGRVAEPMPRFAVGVVDALPKVLVHRLLEPVFAKLDEMRFVCREGDHPDLLDRLAAHGLDAVLADSPVEPSAKLRLHHHRLGSSRVAFFAATKLARRLRGRFPANLDGAPMVLPCQDTSLRRELQLWLASRNVAPRIVAEVDDSALLTAMGHGGIGVFPAPAVAGVARSEDIRQIGETDEVSQSVYMITAERRVSNPWALALSRHARTVFGT